MFVLPASRAKEDDAWGRCGPTQDGFWTCLLRGASYKGRQVPTNRMQLPAQYRHSCPARSPAAHRRFKISTDGVFAPANYMVRYNTSGGVSDSRPADADLAVRCRQLLYQR